MLTSLLRDGEGKEKERWREMEICSSQGRRFFLLGTICFGFFFCLLFLYMGDNHEGRDERTWGWGRLREEKSL